MAAPTPPAAAVDRLTKVATEQLALIESIADAQRTQGEQLVLTARRVEVVADRLAGLTLVVDALFEDVRVLKEKMAVAKTKPLKTDVGKTETGKAGRSQPAPVAPPPKPISPAGYEFLARPVVAATETNTTRMTRRILTRELTGWGLVWPITAEILAGIVLVFFAVTATALCFLDQILLPPLVPHTPFALVLRLVLMLTIWCGLGLFLVFALYGSAWHLRREREVVLIAAARGLDALDKLFDKLYFYD